MLFLTRHLSAQEKPTLKRHYVTCSDSSVDPHILIYDFKSKHFFYKEKWVENLNQVSAVFNQEFKIKVVNVNRYIYNIDLVANDVEFGSNPPELFKQLFLGDGNVLDNLLAKLNTDKMIDPKMQITNIGNAKIIANDSIEKLKNLFILALDSFKEEYNLMLENQLKVYDFCPATIECCDQKHDKQKFKEFADLILQLKFSYLEYNSGFSSEMARLQKQIEFLNVELDSANEIGKGKKIATMNKKHVDSIKNKIIQLNQEKASKESVKADIDIIFESISTIKDEDLMKLVLFNQNMVADHFSYTSPPIFPNSNKLNIGIKFNPVDSSPIKKWDIMPLVDDSLGLEILVKDKWFISFSSGPFVGLGKSIQDDTYGWQAQLDSNGVISDASPYKLVNTGNSGLPIGLAAYANMGTKLTTGFGIGLSVGVGVVIEKDPKPVYLLGGSLYFGGKQQLNITGGVSLMHVDRLKSELYPNLSGNLYSNKSTQIEYSSELRIGGFISVSYTLFSMDRTRNQHSKSD